MFSAVNPADGSVFKKYIEFTHEEVEETLEKARKCFQEWSQTTFEVRAQKLHALASQLRNSTEKLAQLMTQEMGKPIREARAEILKCALACDFFADHGPQLLEQENIKTEFQKSYVRFEPLGIVLGIMPWNFPFWQVFRFAPAAVMAGNGVILKHASNVPGCSLAIEELFRKAGFPEHLFRSLIIDSTVVRSLIEDPRINAVTLTGSEKAGESVATAAGKALKKTVLELGGSDAFIVLEDADLAQCVKMAVAARLVNGGQSCIAAKRFIITRSLVAPFCNQLLERLKKVVVGNPMDDNTDVGPLAREDLLAVLEKQVYDSVKKGAELLIGGKRLQQPGFFFPPTVLRNVKKGMPVYEEETFGPVFAIIEAKDAEGAIAIANDSKYGLGASVWTQDMNKAQEIASKIQAGSVFINERVVSHVSLPFGGVKYSGYGRELSQYGIKEFVNIKTVVLGYGQTA